MQLFRRALPTELFTDLSQNALRWQREAVVFVWETDFVDVLVCGIWRQSLVELVWGFFLADGFVTVWAQW